MPYPNELNRYTKMIGRVNRDWLMKDDKKPCQTAVPVNIWPCFLSLQYTIIATGSANMNTLSIMAFPMSWIFPLCDYNAQSCSFYIHDTLAQQVPMDLKIIYVLQNVKKKPMICIFFILADICVLWIFFRCWLES